MRFEELLERQERGDLSQLEASEMLGMSERTFRRWRDRLRDEGEEGLLDRRIGKPRRRGREKRGLRLVARRRVSWRGRGRSTRRCTVASEGSNY